MFRISDNYLHGPQVDLQYNYAADENCRLWKQQTNTNASLDEIYVVVYKYSTEELTGLLSLKGSDTTRFLGLSSFVETLRNDPEAKELLLLAKRCESLRSDMNSAWYYPSKKDPYRLSLDEVARKAMEYTGSRFRSRYALQAVRALLSLRRYDECINYWTSVEKKIGDDVVARMALRYVAGAYYNLGDTEKAKALYGQAGDTDALFRCSEREGRDAMETVYAFYPEATVLRDWVERTIVHAEIEMEGYCGHYRGQTYLMEIGDLQESTRSGLMKLREFCLKAGKEGRVSDPGLWYYSAAFIDHLLGDDTSALRIITRAEQTRSSQFIKESIRVFRIYLNALTTPWSASYASQMMSELRWLDEKIGEDIASCSDNTMWDLRTNTSSYYWNDMMRKIVLTAVCPKLMVHHQVPMALGFANMADNRLLNQKEVVDTDQDGKPLTMTAYRKSRLHNVYDWQNTLFGILDTVGVENIIRYVEMVEHPRSMTESFLNERGYTNTAFFRDIIGTRLLREMRYTEAEQWLSTVPADFQNELNTYREGYMRRDPFSLTFQYIASQADYKYEFAREMSSLERSIRITNDPDRKALLLLKYAIGMKSSITQCWPLTFYGKSEADTDPEWEPPTEFAKSSKRILASADRFFRQAESTAQSPEIQAQIQLVLGNTGTVMNDYPGTKAASSLRGRCDIYYSDYHFDRVVRAGYNKWE